MGNKGIACCRENEQNKKTDKRTQDILNAKVWNEKRYRVRYMTYIRKYNLVMSNEREMEEKENWRSGEYEKRKELIK